MSAGIRWTGFIVLTGAAVWMVHRALSSFSAVLVPLALAVLISGLLMPVQVFFNHRLRLPRILAALLTVAMAVGSIGTAVWFAGSSLARGIADVRQTAGAELERILDRVMETTLIDEDSLNDAVQDAVDWIAGNRSEIASGVMGASLGAAGQLFGLLLCLFITLFLLAHGDRIVAWLVCLLPRHWREVTYQSGRRGWVTVASFARMQVVVAAVDAAGIGLGAWILGVPFVGALTAITFLLCFIPVVGAVASGALVVLVALAFGGPGTALAMLAVVVVVQQAESSILSPLLMSKAVNIHPLAVLLGVAAGGYQFGVMGALLAVPILAGANTIAEYVAGRDPFPVLDQGGAALTDSPRRLVGPKIDTSAPPRLGEATPQWLEDLRRRQQTR